MTQSNCYAALKFLTLNILAHYFKIDLIFQHMGKAYTHFFPRRGIVTWTGPIKSPESIDSFSMKPGEAGPKCSHLSGTSACLHSHQRGLWSFSNSIQFGGQTSTSLPQTSCYKPQSQIFHKNDSISWHQFSMVITCLSPMTKHLTSTDESSLLAHSSKWWWRNRAAGQAWSVMAELCVSCLLLSAGQKARS